MSKNTQWVLGNHAVSAVLNKSPERVVSVHAVANNLNKKNTNKMQQSLLTIVEQLGLGINYTDKASLNKQCGSEHHQGIALQVIPKQTLTENDLDDFIAEIQSPFLLILDQIQDPHNLGACIRTADAAGIDALVMAKDNTAPISPVVQKVASGAVESLTIFKVTNLARAIEKIKTLGVWVIGTSDRATESLYQQKLDGPIAIVMGSEGKGLRSLTEKKCDALVRLPMASDVVSSLNVSVATGVCLYEVVRQRSLI